MNVNPFSYLMNKISQKVPVGIYSSITNGNGEAVIQCEKNTTIYVMDKKAYINIIVSAQYQYYSVTEIGKAPGVTWSYDDNTGVFTISGLRAETHFFYFKQQT